MGPHDGRVDHHPDGAPAGGLGGHLPEQPLEPPRGDPASEAVVDGGPVAEERGQVPPGDAGAGPVEDRPEEHAVVQVGGRAQAGLAAFDHGPHHGPDLVGDGEAHGRERARGLVSCGRIASNLLSENVLLRQHALGRVDG